MDELRKRKSIRLKNANYSDVGTYFITICTKDRKCILSQIINPTDVPQKPQNIGVDVPGDPYTKLLPYGKIADKYINQLNDFYTNISVESYVIMPNHIHFILFISESECGPSGTPVPTVVQNSTVSRFVSTFKRFCNKEYGQNIWQSRSYDHIIRNRQDYEEHLKYIYDNPMKWYFDELYSDDERL